MFQKTIQELASNPKNVFLIDGLGALLSAFLLGVVLVKFESTFGMPKKELYYLAGAACLFIIYDIVCYFNAKENWRNLVKGIALINLMYCFISLGLVIMNQEKLTVLGYGYFVVEIMILLFMVNFEFKIAKTFIENE